MKSYTNLEQSKKLAEILPLESADMKWFFWKEEIVKLPTFGYSEVSAEFYKETEAVYLPCWSLAALLDVLPNCTDIVKEEADTENEKYMCTVGVTNDIISTFGNNPIDACVEMIEKLHKQMIYDFNNN